MIDNLNRYFDHTNLKQDAVEKDIVKLCQEAILCNFYSVVVNPIWIKKAKKELYRSGVKVASVAGFPIGANKTETKLNEALKAVSDGAEEIDMVVSIGDILSGNYKSVEDEISAVRNSLPYNIVLKIIIESGKLSKKQITSAVKTVINGGAQFVKTSTGFYAPVTVEEIEILYQASDKQIEVKAAGGIRSLSSCESLIKAGAARLGCSMSAKLFNEWKK